MKRTMWVTAILIVTLNAVPAAAEPLLWQALRDGRAAVLIRHALAPGTGDPAAFDVGDCATQRNLSEEGRAQARRIGDMFRANGIDTATILTSQWCRCRDTATEMALGPVQDASFLNSFFANRGDGPDQTAALRAYLIATALNAPVVMITHQVNITALTGHFPRSGEIVFIAMPVDENVRILGTIQTLQ
ncbi:histidine phosphatase family protein [Pacificispira sp.]|uniref:histidine phosphatase family protein n=1 Tax=Pacificispira sp. TaxID=2888761 RepID=UPI003BAA524C